MKLIKTFFAPLLCLIFSKTANKDDSGEKLFHRAVGYNLLLANYKPFIGVDLAMPLYQNYNGIFMDEDLAANSCIKHAS